MRLFNTHNKTFNSANFHNTMCVLTRSHPNNKISKINHSRTNNSNQFLACTIQKPISFKSNSIKENPTTNSNQLLQCIQPKTKQTHPIETNEQRRKSTEISKCLQFVPPLQKKFIKKENKVKYVMTEKEVFNSLDHPFIMQLYYTFQVRTCD